MVPDFGLSSISDGIVRLESPATSDSRGCDNEALNVPRQNGGSHHNHTKKKNKKATPASTSNTSTTLTSTSRQRCRDFVTSMSPAKNCPTNLSVVMMQPPPRAPSPGDADPGGGEGGNGNEGTGGTGVGSEEWLLPLLAKEFIEDHDLEWRELDYNADVGPPPSSFWVFMCQYDCKVFHSGMSER